jgi:hypothetical protein
MFTLTYRAVAAFLLIWAVATPLARAAEDPPLSPEAILEKNAAGKATVEFSVGEVYLSPASWAVSSDRRWQAVPLRITPKSDKAKERVMVLVSGETTARLKRLGIDNPAGHFRGRILRVAGTVERFQTRAGPEYRIQVNRLDQLEVVRKP